MSFNCILHGSPVHRPSVPSNRDFAGVYTRIIALGLIPIALGATFVHLGNGWVFSAEGGGWEFPLFLTVTTLVQAMLGAGALALRAPDLPFLPRALQA